MTEILEKQWRKLNIMNSNIILEFLDKYKDLDELCRQILSSDRGISQYIDEMDSERQGYMMVDGWERDYKQLNKMRRIRNRLVHETDSFSDNLVNAEDIKWLHKFYCRIMECTDPFSLLYQSKKTDRKICRQEKSPEIYFSPKKELSPKKEFPYKNRNLQNKKKVLIVIILIVAFLIGLILLFGEILYNLYLVFY